MLAGMNRGMEEAEEQTSDLEDWVMEINQREKNSATWDETKGTQWLQQT